MRHREECQAQTRCGRARGIPAGKGSRRSANRCRAPSQCPRSSQSKACGNNGPAGWICGQCCWRKKGRTGSQESCQSLLDAEFSAAARKKHVLGSLVSDHTPVTYCAAVLCSGQDSWPPPYGKCHYGTHGNFFNGLLYSRLHRIGLSLKPRNST